MIDQVHLVLTIHSACPSRAGLLLMPIKSRARVHVMDTDSSDSARPTATAPPNPPCPQGPRRAL